MKFMSSLQCLMGGNVVQFQEHLRPSASQQQQQQLDNYVNKHDNDSDDDGKRKKKIKIKTKKKKIKERKVIKVLKPDGEINLYYKAVKVSEVMTEEYMVCRSDSFYIGQKIPPLPQDDRLQPGNTYFLLPAHLFNSVLSFVTIASSFTSSSSSDEQQQYQSSSNMMKMKQAAFLKKAAASSCSPFDIQKTPSGTLRIRVSEVFIAQLMMDQAKATASSSNDLLKPADDDDHHHLLCTTPLLHREYKQLVVGSRRGWKPRLEIIKETQSKGGGKRKVKMLLSASISRMKRKMQKKPSSIKISSSTASSSQPLSLKTTKIRKKKLIKTKKSTVIVSASLKPPNKNSKTTT